MPRNAAIIPLPPGLKVIEGIKAETPRDVRELAEDVVAHVHTSDVAVEGIAVVMVMADGTTWIRVTKSTARHRMLAGITDLQHDFQRGTPLD